MQPRRDLEILRPQACVQSVPHPSPPNHQHYLQRPTWDKSTDGEEPRMSHLQMIQGAQNEACLHGASPFPVMLL